MLISLIVAVSKNNAIGYQGKMPWHLRTDLKYFKQVTANKIVIMGRATYESIGKALPNRTNIVISRNKNFVAADSIVVHSIEEALDKARSLQASSSDSECFIIGGANIYAQTLNLADKIYLTRVLADIKPADSFFADLDHNQWQAVSAEFKSASEFDDYDMEFVVYHRKA